MRSRIRGQLLRLFHRGDWYSDYGVFDVYQRLEHYTLRAFYATMHCQRYYEINVVVTSEKK